MDIGEKKERKTREEKGEKHGLKKEKSEGEKKEKENRCGFFSRTYVIDLHIERQTHSLTRS